jgi:ubiquinone/menaquinone biosynthesis C-methylase UbiE
MSAKPAHTAPLKPEPAGDASVAAHAALFDGVASRDANKKQEVPLNASRQLASRRASFAWFDAWLGEQSIDGSQALDLGCGRGEVSAQLALLGADVTGIDISTESLSRARRLAQMHGVTNRIEFMEGNAETLPFDDNRFDLAVSAGVMSFVDFDRAIAELARVVNQGGTAVILDTLGHNPVARLRRRRHLVTGRTTRFQVENILTCSHLDRLRAHFGQVDVQVFDLLTVPMMFVEIALNRIHPALGKLCAPVASGLRALDRVILKWRPLRRYAFRVVVVVKWPRAHIRD